MCYLCELPMAIRVAALATDERFEYDGKTVEIAAACAAGA
jgi:hypothetical protein